MAENSKPLLLKKDKKKPAKGLLIKLFILVFFVYMCFAMVSQQIQINSKQASLAKLSEQIKVQNSKNDELQKVLNADEKQTKQYIEKIARENLNLSRPGERIYIGISGN